MRLRPAACLALVLSVLAASAPTAVRAQARYSPYVALGAGKLANSHAGGSIAASAAIFRQPGRVVGWGLELGYQRFGVAPQPNLVGQCHILPPAPCVRPMAFHSDGHGQAWYVGPALRVRARGGRVRPFVLVGLGLYGAQERTAVEYRDGEGQVLTDVGPAHATTRFQGLGGNAGLGLEWYPSERRLGWTVAVRRHTAIGAGDATFGGSGTYTATVGLTRP